MILRLNRSGTCVNPQSWTATLLPNRLDAPPARSRAGFALRALKLRTHRQQRDRTRDDDAAKFSLRVVAGPAAKAPHPTKAPPTNARNRRGASSRDACDEWNVPVGMGYTALSSRNRCVHHVLAPTSRHLREHLDLYIDHRVQLRR
jgi:hypothetical protein